MANNKSLPTHIAIIMDGNRRWARKNRLPLLFGHKKGARETIEPIVDRCLDLGIKYVTFWAFSTENWERDKTEVEGLLSLFRNVLKESIDIMNKKGVRVKTIGDLSKFPIDIQRNLNEDIKKTKDNNKLTMTLALNYGGRDEIIRAIKKIPQEKISTITKDYFSNFLDTKNLPDPDLLIRTGGESRLSGFLLWQIEYTEIYFTDLLWPDFTPRDLDVAIEEYQKRQRRFGK